MKINPPKIWQLSQLNNSPLATKINPYSSTSTTLGPRKLGMRGGPAISALLCTCTALRFDPFAGINIAKCESSSASAAASSHVLYLAGARRGRALHFRPRATADFSLSRASWALGGQSKSLLVLRLEDILGKERERVCEWVRAKILGLKLHSRKIAHCA